MIDLILTICALNAPADCSERRLAFVSDESPMRCMMRAPPTIAQWAREHPQMRVARWRCAYPGAEGARI